MFNGELKPFDKITVKDIEDAYAVTHWNETFQRGSDLEIRPEFDSEKQFAETLAHEMVHLRSAQKKQVAGHGRLFKRFKKKIIAKHGMDIES